MLKKKKQTKDQPIDLSQYYPIYHDGVKYERKDCDVDFKHLYEGAGIGRMALCMGSLYYVMDGMYMAPNGDTIED